MLPVLVRKAGENPRVWEAGHQGSARPGLFCFDGDAALTFRPQALHLALMPPTPPRLSPHSPGW